MPNGEPIDAKDYIDQRVDDILRSVAERFEEVRRAVDIAASMPQPDNVPLQKYLEAVFGEYKEATQHATELAADEREKSARALASNLTRLITDTASGLREHIDSQVVQIQAALLSAEKLETERLAAMHAKTEAVQRELQLIQNASKEAIAKAEAANEKRFGSVNEWRGQSADRERSQQESMAALSSTFIPREVADAQFTELRRQIGELTAKVGKIVE